MMNEQLELEIFYILAEGDIITLGDQKEVCRAIAALFPPPNLAKFALRGIVAQLESCGYKGEAGPLENNTAFMALRELAECPQPEPPATEREAFMAKHGLGEEDMINDISPIPDHNS